MRTSRRPASSSATAAAAVVLVAAGLVLGSAGADAASGGVAVLPGAGTAPEPLPAGDYAGSFANVADAPSGTKPITGKATMVISASGTKVSIQAAGLDPAAVYVSHVHKQACANGEGGSHFQFDPAGPMAPPNELWLTPVKVDGKGTGTAAVTADRKADSSAMSVVIHLKRAAGASADEAKPPKLACADLTAVKAAKADSSGDSGTAPRKVHAGTGGQASEPDPGGDGRG